VHHYAGGLEEWSDHERDAASRPIASSRGAMSLRERGAVRRRVRIRLLAARALRAEIALDECRRHRHRDAGSAVGVLLACAHTRRAERTPALTGSVPVMARLAREICGDCVPREFAPVLRTWMDQIQRMAGEVEQS